MSWLEQIFRRVWEGSREVELQRSCELELGCKGSLMSGYGTKIRFHSSGRQL